MPISWIGGYILMVYFLSEETTSGDASVVTSPQHIDSHESA
jgi:hypothetical protein